MRKTILRATAQAVVLSLVGCHGRMTAKHMPILPRRLAAGERYNDYRGVDLRGANLPPRPVNGGEHYERGRALEARRDYRRAAAEFDLARRKHPDQVESGLQLAVCYDELGQRGRSLELIRQVLRRRLPPYQASWALGFEGRVLLHLRRLPEAARALRRSLKLNPHQWAASLDLGVMAAAKGRLDEARSHFRAAARDAPTRSGFADAYTRLGQVAGERGDFGTARAELLLALRFDPTNKRARYDMRVLGALPDKRAPGLGKEKTR